MNLISCDSCGVVLDKDKLYFPDAYAEDEKKSKSAYWNGERYVSSVPCPICGDLIAEA